MMGRTMRPRGLNSLSPLRTVAALTGLLGAACITKTPPPLSEQTAPIESTRAEVQTPAVQGDSPAEIPIRLAAEHISPVIAAVAPRLKAECWQPALDSRSKDAPLSARVVARLDIEPSGRVIAFHTEDEPAAYPELVDCVATIVRSLKFPRAAAATAANVPFLFEAP